MKTESTLNPNSPAENPTTVLLTPSVGDFARLGGRQLTPYEQHRVERLHDRAPAIVKQARVVGVEIGYLGVAGLFNETRIYKGVDNDWALAPVNESDLVVAPRIQRDILRRLEKADIAPFLAYEAHEIDRAKNQEALAELPAGRAVIPREQAAELVGPVPAPAGTLELATRLDEHSTRVLTTLRRGALVGGGALLGVLAAPFLLAGAVVGAAAGADPILIGALPALRSQVGEPALFFELCRWNW